MSRFDGKAYLITGGGKGIGAALADEVAAGGGAVAVFDIDGDAATEKAAQILAGGGRALAIKGDARDDAAVRSAVAAVVDEFGRINGLAAIAGVLRLAPIAEVPDSHWRDVVETNVLGPFQFVRAVVPHLRAAGGGSIVLAGSAMAFASNPTAALYSASKGAIVAMVNSLAVELATEGIRVNCFAPGTVRTPMARELAQMQGTSGDIEAVVDSFGQGHPMGRVIEAEEVARVAAFLLSDEASAVTGSCYGVDAGMLANLA
ncbi:SDR family NAD(P)-dependent oxidoreductase [Streptomyces hainanensis]|uniref:SDR family oxidoreductase n=1 Tax=Streptomyces hainanensis TaxID=402648 RepID=A0A4R4TR80_9ACTN|nr:SDR family NAD(P)-dependent oxidoreductase [Streptomyces hainanensis]TDC80510.1 SDR family oxidoreductase [Streptomyces hainanensis]